MKRVRRFYLLTVLFMINNKIYKNRIFLCLLAFTVPFFAMLLGAMAAHIEPFGENGFLVSDINAQFAAFFSYWKNTVLSDTDNFKFTLSKTLGGSMSGFKGYYLNNPFLFLLFLFPDEKISVGIYYMLSLQVGLMGLTFELMLLGMWKISSEKLIKENTCGKTDNALVPDKKAPVYHLIFSWGYALSGYVMAYLTIPMYYCSLILLPVIFLGLNMMMSRPCGFSAQGKEDCLKNECSGKIKCCFYNLRMFIFKYKRQLVGMMVYITSLAAAIWSNYYTGYMICIFLALYFIACRICGLSENRLACVSKENSAARKRCVCRGAALQWIVFIFASLFAVALTLISLIPTIKSLSGQKTSDLSAVLDFSLSYHPKELILNLLPGNFSCDFSNGAAPCIYVGLVPLVCVVLFLLPKFRKYSLKSPVKGYSQSAVLLSDNKVLLRSNSDSEEVSLTSLNMPRGAWFYRRSISLRRKITGLSLLIILLLSTLVTGLDNVWHGFNSPVGFSHRQSFILVFMLLLLGAKGLDEFITGSEDCAVNSGEGEIKPKDSDVKPTDCEAKLRANEAKAARLKVNAVNEVKFKTDKAKAAKLKETAAKLKVYVVPLIVILQAGELSYNTVSSLKAYESAEMNSQQEFEEFYLVNKQIVDKIASENEPDSVYRIEKDYFLNHNDAMLLGYNGLSHNSSCESETVKKFCARLGLRNQGIWASYIDGSTTFADSLLGVKYFISRFDSTDKPYESDFSHEDRYVYKNPYALNIAWKDSLEHVLSVDMENQNLFEVQNQMAGYSIYTPAKFEESLSGLKASVCETAKADFINESTDETVGVKNTGSGTASRLPDEYTLYTRDKSEPENNDAGAVSGDEAAMSYEVNSEDICCIDYEVMLDSDCVLYCYFAAPREQGAKLYVNGGDRDDYFSDFRWNIVNVGSFLKGDKVTVRLEVTGDELEFYDAYFYEEHLDVIEQWYKGVVGTSAENRENSGTCSAFVPAAETLNSNISVSKVTSSEYVVVNNEAGSENINDLEIASQTGKGVLKDEDILIFSIPYDENMTVMIDGARAQTIMVYDCLLAVKLPGDWQEITLNQ